MYGCEHPVITILGQLGGLVWGRCRCCGLDVRTEPDDHAPDPYELALAALED